MPTYYYDEYETCAVCGEEAHESDCAVIQLDEGLRVVVCGEECEEAAPFRALPMMRDIIDGLGGMPAMPEE